ncbi:MAG TPA: enoyl-CoA hydratase/isomerase family protein, partial [Burkholderiaceae bacterium]|nr:enoyl-CoA hydratase/isomerase family protein [Burkholderiaceae bacterium]
MSEMAVLCAASDGAMWITLNRPAAMNAITPAIVEGIETALDQALNDPQVRAIVLTGTGRAFCAGADLKYVREQTHGDESANAAFLQTVLHLMNRLETFPKPVIAAINGLALAGGLELVLCCDLVIAARSAKIGDAHANFGLLPGGGSSVRLP